MKARLRLPVQDDRDVETTAAVTSVSSSFSRAFHSLLSIDCSAAVDSNNTALLTIISGACIVQYLAYTSSSMKP